MEGGETVSFCRPPNAKALCFSESPVTGSFLQKWLLLVSFLFPWNKSGLRRFLSAAVSISPAWSKLHFAVPLAHSKKNADMLPLGHCFFPAFLLVFLPGQLLLDLCLVLSSDPLVLAEQDMLVCHFRRSPSPMRNTFLMFLLALLGILFPSLWLLLYCSKLGTVSLFFLVLLKMEFMILFCWYCWLYMIFRRGKRNCWLYRAALVDSRSLKRQFCSHIQVFLEREIEIATILSLCQSQGPLWA